jgi:hypothetical protein
MLKAKNLADSPELELQVHCYLGVLSRLPSQRREIKRMGIGLIRSGHRMFKTLKAILFFCSLLFATSAFPQSHHSGTHSSKPHSSKSNKSSSASSSSHSIAPSHAYKKNHLAEGYTAHPSVQRDKHGKIKRSSSAKAAFERQSPCPSTGKISGSCKGYVVDHIKPLECGGADAPSNMQWQTVADGKAKDKTERSCR